jgi:hypothetical protein
MEAEEGEFRGDMMKKNNEFNNCKIKEDACLWKEIWGWIRGTKEYQVVRQRHVDEIWEKKREEKPDIPLGWYI